MERYFFVCFQFVTTQHPTKINDLQDEIIYFCGRTRRKAPANEVLSSYINFNMQHVVMCVFDSRFYYNLFY